MSVHPARIDDVEPFDVERDARPVRGQLRPAPDWGSDDLFDHVPRRRFAPREEDGRAAARAGASRPVVARESAGPREDAGRASEVIDLETRRASAPAAVERPAAATVVELDVPASWADDRPIVDGRRTVTITGRPGERSLPPRRDRPSRAPGTGRAHALAARPDRIMGWACALGVLLILIALLT